MATNTEVAEENTTASNPHEAQAKTTKSRKTTPKKTEDKKAETISGFDDESLSREERLAKMSATVDGTTYEFPIDKLNFNTAMQLSMEFQKENLKPGQVFSINPHRNVFFFLPECNIGLNTENYTWTYEAGSLAPDQLGYLLHAVRSCDLLVGDIEIVQNKPKPSVSTVDCASILSRPMDSIREEVKKILAKRQTVKNDGEIVSPGIDLKALLKYETSHENRKSVKELLNSALNRIGGMVEFLNQFDEEEDVGARKIAPIPSQGKDFVNQVM